MPHVIDWRKTLHALLQNGTVFDAVLLWAEERRTRRQEVVCPIIKARKELEKIRGANGEIAAELASALQ